MGNDFADILLTIQRNLKLLEDGGDVKAIGESALFLFDTIIHMINHVIRQVKFDVIENTPK